MEYKDFTKEYHAHNLHLYQMDCMDLLKQTPDNYYNLCIVDPPYGIGFGAFNRTNKDSLGNRVKADAYKNSDWDQSIPTREYFDLLLSKSKNAIIWGGKLLPIIMGNGM